MLFFNWIVARGRNYVCIEINVEVRDELSLERVNQNDIYGGSPWHGTIELATPPFVRPEWSRCSQFFFQIHLILSIHVLDIDCFRENL
jgi:hypothetical protein